MFHWSSELNVLLILFDQFRYLNIPRKSDQLNWSGNQYLSTGAWLEKTPLVGENKPQNKNEVWEELEKNHCASPNNVAIFDMANPNLGITYDDIIYIFLKK